MKYQPGTAAIPKRACAFLVPPFWLAMQQFELLALSLLDIHRESWPRFQE